MNSCNRNKFVISWKLQLSTKFRCPSPLIFRYTRLSQNQESGRINGKSTDLRELDIQHRIEPSETAPIALPAVSHIGKRSESFFPRYKLAMSSTQPLPRTSRASIHPLVVPFTFLPRNLRYLLQLLQHFTPIHLSMSQDKNTLTSICNSDRPLLLKSDFQNWTYKRGNE